MRSTVAQFCKQCGICALTKDSTQHVHRALQPLPVPLARFHSYTLDFATNLPPSRGFNHVLTIVNHFTKFTYLIPCTMGEDKLSAAQVAKLLFENFLGFLVYQKSLFMIMIPGLLLIFGVNYGVFLALKPVPLPHFTLKVMGKVSAPIAHLNKFYMHTFTTNLYQHGYMHYHLQNLQLRVQLARALDIHPFSCCMGRKSLCPSIMHLQTHLTAQCNLQLQAY